jgi:hypothetical protein
MNDAPLTPEALAELVALEDTLDLTRNQMAGPDKARFEKSVACAEDLLDRMARRLGDSPHAQLDCVIAMAAEVLGRASWDPNDLEAGADALRQGAFNQSLVVAVRRKIEQTREALQDADGE